MLKNKLKLLIDFIPLVAFFTAFKFAPEEANDVVFATGILVLFTILGMILMKFAKIKVEKINFYSNVAVIFFGSMTLLFEDPLFIKAKLTLLNFLIFAVMIFFYLRKKLVLKSLFQGKIEMEDKYWNILNLRFAFMFCLIALLNLFFVYFTSDATWVKFKTFGVLPFILVYFLFQVRFIVKNSKKI